MTRIALLRDEKDWDPNQMLKVTESFGRTSRALKETLETMKPKENSDQRKSRLRREAREAKTAAASPALKTPKKSTSGNRTATTKPKVSVTRPAAKTPPQKKTIPPKTKSNSKPRRARKLVSAV